MRPAVRRGATEADANSRTRRPTGGRAVSAVRPMSNWDPARAWRFIRASKGYRTAWRRRRRLSGLTEPAPFEIRWQTEADLGALGWGLAAWADPDADPGPLSPFWAHAPMLDGRVERDAAPLAELAAADHAALAGLRVGGALILKIERGGAAVQIRIAGSGAFPADGGLLLVREGGADRGRVVRRPEPGFGAAGGQGREIAVRAGT